MEKLIKGFFGDSTVLGGKFFSHIYIEDKDPDKTVNAITLVVNCPYFVKVLEIAANPALPQEIIPLDVNKDYEDTIKETEEFRLAWASLKPLPEGKFMVATVLWTVNPFSFVKSKCELGTASPDGAIALTDIEFVEEN